MNNNWILNNLIPEIMKENNIHWYKAEYYAECRIYILIFPFYRYIF
jgi:hypothetical protein